MSAAVEPTEQGGGEFQTVDIGALMTQSQLTPTTTTTTSYDDPTVDSLQFVIVQNPEGDSEPVSGSVDPQDPPFPDSKSFGSQSEGAQSAKLRRRSGSASKFLEGRGFGWLLDVEEDEDEGKPLL